jgi:hypothetical protein
MITNLGLGGFFHSLFSVNAGSFILGPFLNLNMDLTPSCPDQTHHRIDGEIDPSTAPRLRPLVVV